MSKLSQSILYDVYTTANRDLLPTPSKGYTIKNSTTGSYQMWNGTLWNDIQVNPDYFYYDALVGVGTKYATIQEALADGKYSLKLVSEVTETVDWGIHSEEIRIEADEMTTVNMSVTNSAALTIKGNNINFSLSGLNSIFTNSYLSFNILEITGNEDYNIFMGNTGIIDANELKISTGVVLTGTYSIVVKSVRNIGILSIVGETDVVNPFILGTSAKIKYFETSGIFKTNSYFFTCADSIIYNINATHTTPYVGIDLDNSKILKCSGNPVMLSTPRNGSIISNCDVEYVYNTAGTKFNLVNCNIEEFQYDRIDSDLKPRLEGCTIQTLLSLAGDELILENCTFENGVIVRGNNITLNNCEIASGTITVDATADKTNIVGCRTLTPIVDNGTNTQMLANTLL